VDAGTLPPQRTNTRRGAIEEMMRFLAARMPRPAARGLTRKKIANRGRETKS